MSARVMHLAVFMLFIALALSASFAGSCSASDFQIAILKPSNYPNNVDYGEIANITRNADFNNTKFVVSVKTNCSCTPSRMAVYDKDKKLQIDVHLGKGAVGDFNGSFYLNDKYLSFGWANYTNITCDNETYAITRPIAYIHDEEGPSLIYAPKNGTVFYKNNTDITLRFWDPAGIDKNNVYVEVSEGKWNTTSVGRQHANVTITLAASGDTWVQVGVLIKDNLGNERIGDDSKDYDYLLNYLLDLNSPSISSPVITSPTNDPKYQRLPLTIEFNVTEDLSVHCIAELVSGRDEYNVIDETKVPVNRIAEFNTTINNLPDGEYDLNITCTDEGNLTSNRYVRSAFVLDTTPPRIEKVNPKEGAVSSDNELEINATDSGIGVKSCEYIKHEFKDNRTTTGNLVLDNKTGLWTLNTSTNKDDAASYSVLCVDYLNNTGWLNDTLVVDRAPPNTIANATNNAYYNRSITIVFSCKDVGSGCNDTYYQINAQKEQRANVLQLDRDGEYSITYWSTDKAGNKGPQNHLIVHIDTVKPSVGITEPTNTTYDKSTVTLEYRLSDNNLDKCWYNLDGNKTTIDCRSNEVNLTNLSDGVHTVSLWAKDKAGNTASKSVVFTVDTQPPEINYTVKPGRDYILVNASFWDLELAWANITLLLPDNTTKLCQNYTNGTSLNLSCNFTGLEPGKNYTVEIESRDNLGHEAELNFTAKTVVKPVAIADYAPHTPYIWAKVFTAIQSYDPDGHIVSYFWDFGDGTNATGETVTHVFKSPGVYNVSLTVRDNDNLTDTKIMQVEIKGIPVHTGGGGGSWSAGVAAFVGTTATTHKTKGIWGYKLGRINWETRYDSTRNMTTITMRIIGNGRIKIVQPLPSDMQLSEINIEPKWDRIENGKLVWIVDLTGNQTLTIREAIPGKLDETKLDALKPVITNAPRVRHVSRPAKIERMENTNQAKKASANESQTIKQPKVAKITGRAVQNEGNMVLGVIILTAIILAYVFLFRRP